MDNNTWWLNAHAKISKKSLHSYTLNIRFRWNWTCTQNLLLLFKSLTIKWTLNSWVNRICQGLKMQLLPNTKGCRRIYFTKFRKMHQLFICITIWYFHTWLNVLARSQPFAIWYICVAWGNMWTICIAVRLTVTVSKRTKWKLK